MTAVLRKGEHVDVDGRPGRMSCGHEGRGLGEAFTSRGSWKSARKPPGARRESQNRQILPSTFQRDRGSSGTSALQNCLKPSVCGTLLQET